MMPHRFRSARTALPARVLLLVGLSSCATEVLPEPPTDEPSTIETSAVSSPATAAGSSHRGHIAAFVDPREAHVKPEAITSVAAASANDVTYANGPLIGKVKIVAVFWGSSVNSTITGGIGGFYSAVVNHPYMDWLGEYGSASTSIRRGTYAGSFTITPGNTSKSLTDDNIATELASQMGKGKIPLSDGNTLYMVHFPKGIGITEPFGSKSCVGGGFCAYHYFATKKVSTTNRTFFYGVMPDFSAGSGCDVGCGADGMFDNFTSAASHEMIEAITDPKPFTGWNGKNGEIGDTCNQQHATIRNSSGTAYTVQRGWSNITQACVYRRDTDWGYAWANQATGTFTAPDLFSHNSSGDGVATTVSNTGTGQYTVSFPNIGEAVGGNFQVVGYGTGSEYCNIGGWNSSGTTLVANVNCYNSSGSPTNTLFAIDYVRYSDRTMPAFKTNGGYVWADNASASDTPSATYQWNSTAASNTVSHDSTGNYTVTIPGVADSGRGGDVLVTAYGSNARCKVGSWGGSPDITVNVLCFSPSGAATDSRFALRYHIVNTVQARSAAYAWFDQATTASFTPASFYQSGFIGGDGGAIGTITGGRSSKGNYFVDIPSLTPTNSTSMVTAYGSGSNYCKVQGWFGQGSGTRMNVGCFDSTGHAVDSRFVASYANLDFIIK